jgi:hypothetical protein
LLVLDAQPLRAPNHSVKKSRRPSRPW